MQLKLGLDIGISSVGYGIIDENYNVIDSGVRLFSEGTAANNLTRRTMRGARRRIRRQHHRLIRMGKLIGNVFQLDYPNPFGNIYEIRTRGLRKELSNEELFLAIMHLTKRRGTFFLTADDYEEIEGGKSTEAILDAQESALKSQFVCDIQYAKLKKYGKVRGIENHFRNKEYRRELVALLNKQKTYKKEITTDIEAAILKIYDSKREYYEGPGSEKSPTPYGCYRYGKDGEVEYVNLIDLMRGVCTYFNGKNGRPAEKRIAASSYTACAFNLLNDLNNMKLDGKHLSSEHKRMLFDEYVNKGQNVTLDRIQKVSGVKKELMTGYRVDKNGKPEFTKFDRYCAIRKAYEVVNRDLAEIEGNRDKVDDIAEILTKEKSVDERKAELLQIDSDEKLADELKKLNGFTKYHSLSRKAMGLILVDLMETSKNQMQLFSEIGLNRQDDDSLRGSQIKLDMEDWIVSPVTLRAVNETIKVVNAARKLVKKKYGMEFSEIIIEMPRDRNSEEQKKRITDFQKRNEMIHKSIDERFDAKSLYGKQYQIIKLLDEQDWKCAYSGKPITISQVKNNMLEIDHIIPWSLSFDDSQSNKVAVLFTENRNKGQRTPQQYLKSGQGQISYEEFKENVLANKHYGRKKRSYLCYEGDVKKDVWGFIGRNLSDTRYASRKILNLLQDYFHVNELATKVKVVQGSFTYMFRKRAKLSKDREATYAHHAQDALIVAGISNTDIMKKLDSILVQNPEVMEHKNELIFEHGKLIDRLTGVVISEADFKAQNYICFIKDIEQRQQKYSHKVDRKPNRQLYDQQIKSTRVMDVKGKKEAWIVTKYKDIYGTGINKSGEKLAKRMEDKPETLLMYQNDLKTFEIMLEIKNAYPNEKNPFAAYYKEHGAIRKYAKNGNGSVIQDVKFLDKRLGMHRINTHQNGKHKSVYLSIKSLRVDIYMTNGKYTLISVPYDMLDCVKNGYRINESKYQKAKIIKKIDDRAEFCFSLYSGERFSYIKDGKPFEWIYSCVANALTNRIEAKFIDKPSPGDTQGKRLITIGAKISDMKKYNTDVLGNHYSIEKDLLEMEFLW